MKKNLLLILLHLLVFNSILIAQPTITSFAPTSGPIGTTVTISGTNFNPTPANNIVFFGATMASVSAATTTSLSVTVPLGATYQPISVTDLSTNSIAYSSNPFVVTSSCGGTINSASFAPKVDSTTYDSPICVSIGDIDNDGKSDLAVICQTTNSLSVYRNTSSVSAISFAIRVDFATGTTPNRIAIGDLDGDGKLDIAVTYYSSNVVSVYLNTSTIGSISFAPKMDFTTGMSSRYVGIGDIDGDGKLDLAVANNSDNSISVLRNTSTIGSLSFASKIDFTCGSAPCGIAITDIDGDGKSEISVANYFSNTISVFKNTSSVGSISFSPKVDFATGAYPIYISAGDLNGDGKSDLAVMNIGAPIASVFKNTSVSGTISLAPRADFTSGSFSHYISISDLDGDGKPDLITLNNNTISFLKNLSSGGTISFAAKVDYVMSGISLTDISIGDLNNDAKPDLAVITPTFNTVSIFNNLIGTPVMTNPSTTTICSGVNLNLPLTSSSSSSATYTWISNNNPSITGESTSMQTSDTISDILTNNVATIQSLTYTVTPTSTTGCGVGTSDTITVTVNPIPAMTSSSAITIWSCDNVNLPLTSNVASTYTWIATDNVYTTGESITSQTSGTINDVIKNNTTLTQTITYTITPTSSTGCGIGVPQTLTLTVDPHDTILSFIPLSGPVGTTVTITGVNFNPTPIKNIVFFGATQAAVLSGSTTSLTVTVPVGATYQYISVTDTTAHLTEYSLLPYTVTFSCGGTISTTSFAPKVNFSTGIKPGFISIGDLDGDGKPELMVVNYCCSFCTNTVSILKNSSTIGNVSFLFRYPYPSGTHNPKDIKSGDFDGDGKQDLVYADGSDPAISIRRNTSTLGVISFGPDDAQGVGNDPGSVAFGDFDGDGKPDLAVSNDYDASISILKNISTIGTILFSYTVHYPTDGGTETIVAGDIDGDGLEDLIVGEGDDSVSIYKNISTCGNIIFAPKINFITGNFYNKVAIGDIDGDNKPDLVTVRGVNNISILKNTSTPGSISFAPKVDFATGFYPGNVSLGDLDGDGKIDMAVANSDDSTISLYKNNSVIGTIAFSPKVDFVVGFQPNSIAIGDIDGDGKPDLAVANSGSDSLSVLRNIGCFTTDVANDNTERPFMNIYPNPFTSQTTISFSEEQQNVSINVVDVVGKKIKALTFTGNELILEREEMKPGIYFVHIIDRQNKETIQKMMIQ